MDFLTVFVLSRTNQIILHLAKCKPLDPDLLNPKINKSILKEIKNLEMSKKSSQKKSWHLFNVLMLMTDIQFATLIKKDKSRIYTITIFERKIKINQRRSYKHSKIAFLQLTFL